MRARTAQKLAVENFLARETRRRVRSTAMRRLEVEAVGALGPAEDVAPRSPLDHETLYKNVSSRLI